MCRDAVLHGCGDGVDDFARFGAEERASQYLVGLGVDDGFEHTLRRTQYLRTRECRDGDPVDADVAPGLACLLFVHAHMRERRFDEDRIGDGAPVGRGAGSVAQQHVAYDPEVVQRNIGELQPARHVACGEDTGSRRAQVCVDPDGTPVVGFDPGGREVQSCGGGAASRGEQHGVPVDFVFSACLCVGHGDPDAPGGVAHRFDPCAHAEFDALFFQRFPYGGRNVAVFARDQLRKPFEHGDFRSE